MQAHYLQHVPFEGLGSIGTWLDAAGFETTSTRFFESWHLPDVDDVDLLVIMGGPMSVNDEDEFPWLVQEKQFVRKAVLSGKPVFGVCLGAQLIASAMGARVYPNRHKEIGWFPLEGAVGADESVFSFPEVFNAFHWHGETFDLPSGATALAKSKACENQAFQLGESVVGLQFHLEATPESVRELVGHCRAELTPSEYVQSEDEILAAASDKFREANSIVNEVLRFLTGGPRR